MDSFARIVEGDSAELLAQMPSNSVDSLVTDPPAGISFMGKEWDGDKGGRAAWVAWLTGVMAEALRVLKPGAHGLVWGLPRTSHWTATALEDAGFEIRDVVTHLNGQGFPKNRLASLKPASEHWILIRKPLDGTIAANVQKHGTGAINVDACRIAGPPSRGGSTGSSVPIGLLNDDGWQGAGPRSIDRSMAQGRWPANVVFTHSAECVDGTCADGCPVRELDAQSGTLKSGAGQKSKRTSSTWEGGSLMPVETEFFGSSGGASRFFATFTHEDQCHSIRRVFGAVAHSSPIVNAGDIAASPALEPSTQRKTCGCQERSILATQTASKTKGVASTQETQSSDARCSPESERLSTAGTPSPARLAENRRRIDIITTIPSHLSSDGCAEAVTSKSTSSLKGPGVLDCESRFIYVAKPSTSEKEAGLTPGDAKRGNTHPTVKSIALMSYLVKLITPPGGVVLDPFAGSGTTGLACVRGGWSFVGIEKDPTFAQIARERITHWQAKAQPAGQLTIASAIG